MRPLRRLVVEGDSMRPTLVPGDRVVAVAWPRRPPAGALVALRDPRRPERVMVKRLAGSGPGGAVVVGDAPGASTDSRHFGEVPWHLVLGRVVYRYAPAGRAGRLGGPGP
ncbi:MAG TPA: nickel-type superoxide dismutase maturation protease [Acidimicrobiales bacterium]|nr:nickel-type superoxide dismutase maturation protease [Acidimicrobiales bacterium]